MFKAVIFDFDGVITDSEILHFRAFNSMLAPLGVEISLRDYYKDYLGLGDYDLLKLFDDTGVLSLTEEDIASLIIKKHDIFEQLAKTDGKIIEGVREFLALLNKNNIAIGICSGALLPEIELILDQAKLRDNFRTIVSREQIKNGKPHPEGFNVTLERLNKQLKTSMKHGECIVIEDSIWGIQAAIAAKMHVVGVTNSYDGDELKGAEKIVDRLDELTMDDLQKLCS